MEEQRETEREHTLPHVLVHSPNAHCGWGWARQKMGGHPPA